MVPLEACKNGENIFHKHLPLDETTSLGYACVIDREVIAIHFFPRSTPVPFLAGFDG